MVDGCGCQVIHSKSACDAPDFLAIAGLPAFQPIIVRYGGTDTVAIDQTGYGAAVEILHRTGTLLRAWRVDTDCLIAVPVAFDLHALRVLRPAAVTMIVGQEILDGRHVLFPAITRLHIVPSQAPTTMAATAARMNQVGCGIIMTFIVVATSIRQPISSA